MDAHAAANPHLDPDQLDANQSKSSQLDTPGLSLSEAARRLGQDGPNVLPEAPRVGWVGRFAAQFWSPLIAVLLFALAFDLIAWIAEGAQGCRSSWVEKLNAFPDTRKWTGLGFAVSYNSCDNQIRVVMRGTKRMNQDITQFTPLVD